MSSLDAVRARYNVATHLLRRVSVPALRVSIGAVFVWFGALKLFDVTPVGELVRDTVPFVEAPAWIVPAMGVFEVAVGVWLMAGLGLRVLLPVYVAHLLATFGVLVIQPEVAFQAGNPLLLTTEGEFVVKNVVLLAAGVAVCTRTRRGRVSVAPGRDHHALAA